MSAWAVIVAGGSGTRMGLADNKVFAHLGGMTVLERSVSAFTGEVEGCVVVARAQDIARVRALLPGISVVEGGDTRQRSVRNGLRALPELAELVLVHDAARPLVSRETIRDCLRLARAHGGAVAAVPVKDTIKQATPGGAVLKTPARQSLYAAQTPQAFRRAELLQTLDALELAGLTMTDDAGAMEWAGKPVYLAEGSYENIKLTTPEDLAYAGQLLGGVPMQRVGHGYDVHRLVADRKLILCGCEIPFEKGLMGHSDADVATHALMDALLGAAALGDIGRHFPDTDERYAGASSILLLAQVREKLLEKGWTPHNVDVTIVAQRPKLLTYISDMKARIAETLQIAGDQVNVKATTTEGLGYEGEGQGISAHCVATIQRNT